MSCRFLLLLCYLSLVFLSSLLPALGFSRSTMFPLSRSALLLSRNLQPRRSYFALASALLHPPPPSNMLPHSTRFHLESAAAAAERRQSRAEAKALVDARNSHYRALHATSSSSSAMPGLYLLKVTFSPSLRASLRLDSREKRGRLFVDPVALPYVNTLQGLKQEVNLFFRNALRMDECELVVEPLDGPSFPLLADADVTRLFAAAHQQPPEAASTVGDICDEANPQPLQRRPTVSLSISCPNPSPTARSSSRHAPPPYLVGMPPPSSSPSMTMLSFYSFPPSAIADVVAFSEKLKILLKPFECRGRIYVAEEGVNAQMAVPTNV